MAGTDRKTAYNIDAFTRDLADKPYGFSFFQALRLFECFYDQMPRLGTSTQLADDPIRIGQEPATAFESATLTAFKKGAHNKPHRLLVRFLGLLGTNGPLPLHLTEYAQERQIHHHDFTFSRFLDVFNHRMLSLFYRAWANNEPTVSFDRPQSDRFSYYIGSLAGLGMSALRKRDDISDWTKFYYCGWLAGQTKCAEGLQTILSEYFKLKARIGEFTGDWLKLPETQICRLGRNRSSGTVGRSAIVGRRVWACQHKFRIALGPMSYEDYVSLLPIGNRIRRLVALVRNYIGDELAWDVNLILKRKAVPAVRLNGSFHLGWTTWLGKRTEESDADDLELNAFAYVNPKH